MVYSTSFVNTVQGAAVAPEERAELENLVREHVQRARDIDSDDPMWREAIRGLSLVTWNWSAYEQALEPEDEDSLSLAGLWLLSWREETARAVGIAERVAALNPNAPEAQLSLGVVYAYAGNHSASVQSLGRARARSGEPVGSSLACLQCDCRR